MLTISVIIPTYNSAKTIRQCLESISKQTFRPTEIVVVDRFSLDGTPAIAAAFDAQVIQATANRSLARNIGLEHSSSEGAVFVDSDMLLSPDLLEECSQRLQEYQTLVIPEASFGGGFWAKCKSLERQTNLESEIEAARCFRKVVFLSLGGYNPNLEAAEDWDLHSRVQAARFSIGRTNAKLLHDEGNSSLMVMLKKKFFYGEVIGGFIESNPTARRIQLNPVNRILHPSIKVMTSHPIHGTGVLILKTLEFVAAGTGWLKSKTTAQKPRN